MGTQSHRMTSYSRPTDTTDVEWSASGGISGNVIQIRPVTSLRSSSARDCCTVVARLKEFTVTYGFNVADGLQVKTEYRYDWSNVPVFLTSTQNVYSKDQSTATLGLIWWFGRKQGAW